MGFRFIKKCLNLTTIFRTVRNIYRCLYKAMGEFLNNVNIEIKAIWFQDLYHLLNFITDIEGHQMKKN